MTVPSEVDRSGPYNGNGVTTIFNYGFRIVDEAHLSVIKTSVAGVEATLMLDADYIVSDVGSASGGQIACVVAPLTGEKITILRNVPFTQEIDLENQGAYYAETVEVGFDLSAMRDQQLKERLDRAVVIPPSADVGNIDSLIEDIIRLADSADEIDTVAGIAADVTTVAGVAPEVVIVAGIAADVTAVAGVAASVPVVAGVADDVTVVADNIAAILAAQGHAQDAQEAAVEAEASAEAAEAAAASATGVTPVVDRAALKALNTAIKKSASLLENGRRIRFDWDATIPIATHQADASENTYVAPNAAAIGAWVAQAGYFVSDRFPAYRRPLWAKFGDHFTAKDAGVPDDGTDGTSQINDLLQYCKTNTSAVDFTAGRYKITSPLSATISPDRSLIWKGAGRGNSIFEMDTAGNGLNITIPGTWWLDGRAEGGRTGLDLKDMTFATTNALAGIGLNLVGACVQGRPTASVNLSNIEMRAFNSVASQGWADMISLLDISHSWIDNPYLTAAQTGGGRGIVIDGTAQGNSPTVHNIIHPTMYYGSDQIVMGDYVEGVYVTQPTMVGGARGIYQNAAVAESGLHVVGGHISSTQACIDLRNLFDFEIIGALFYRQGTTTPNFAAVRLENAGRFTITGNTIKGGNSGGDEAGIQVVSSSNNEIHGGDIADNAIHSFSGMAIWLAAGSNYVDVGHNTFRGNAQNVLDQSTNNTNSITPKIWGGTQQKTLVGGAATEAINFTIPTGMFRLKAGGGFCIPDAAHSGVLMAEYDFTNSTTTNARFTVRNRAGGNITAGTYRFSVEVIENVLARAT